MPHNGFRLDEVDYAFAGNKTMGLDSLWTLAIWGQDLETTDYYYVTAGVNNNFYPFEMAEVTDDKYFSGNVINGFPIATLMQYSIMRKLYGDCAKYLETGDLVTLEAMTLSKDFYDYLVAVLLNGAVSAIPLFSPQPANCPTNIKGGDGNVAGLSDRTTAERSLNNGVLPLSSLSLPLDLAGIWIYSFRFISAPGFANNRINLIFTQEYCLPQYVRVCTAI